MYTEQTALEFMRDALIFCKANAGKPELVWRAANEALLVFNASKENHVECYCCCGTGRIVRDPDIGTDQECFYCNGEGVVND